MFTNRNKADRRTRRGSREPASPATTTRARYDFDSDYLIEMEPHVRHYDLYCATSPDPSLLAAVLHNREFMIINSSAPIAARKT